MKDVFIYKINSGVIEKLNDLPDGFGFTSSVYEYRGEIHAWGINN